MPILRKTLDAIEFARLDFHFLLDIDEPLPERFELALRPLLLKIGEELLPPERFEQLFTPALPDDPTALRRYQRPAPPFVLQPQPPRLSREIRAKNLTLSLMLFGDGIALLDDLVQTLQSAGERGLYHGRGQGTLVAVEARDLSGTTTRVWERQSSIDCAPPPRMIARWWLEDAPSSDHWKLEIVTPARLMSKGKPLFRPAFRHLLPFVLRRVTSMGYTWCGVEIDDTSALLELAEKLQHEDGTLRWEDWRSVEGDDELQGLGGVTGSLLLHGPLPDELLTLLRLGSLMNIGKGAAWGAGNYRIDPA